ncbi:serine protease inhibitor 42Dd [Tetranychus urticae]|uniref:Serpin domain-containing protein n=1 Tax=Tetranychus urticae TaxID=32264 RepID=T1K451_TETUR|nr:serine protease inhibitor 42Dd [Tetranychus urticae]
MLTSFTIPVKYIILLIILCKVCKSYNLPQQSPKSAPKLPSSSGSSPPTSKPSSIGSYEKCYDDDDVANGHLSDSPSEYSRTLISGLHKFSIDILRSLHNFESKDSSPGLILSPFSIWSALLVSYMGARHETDRELRSVLGLNNVPKHAVGMAYQGLRFWYQLKRNVSLVTKETSKKQAYSIANKIFINDALTLNDCIKQHFATEAESMDFTSNPGGALKAINSWIEEETHGKIKDLIPPGSVTQWTTIIIANAIYFHAKWYNQFDASKTEIGTFHVTPVESIQIPFMKLTANLMYGVSEALRCTVLELPYANQDFSMLILLPDASKGVDSLVRQLKPSHLEDVVANMFDDEISVVLPKFKAEQELELSGPLYSMGIMKLFDPRFADLSGFFQPASANKNGKNKNTTHELQTKGITVNSVVHKVYVSVNEEGTEAAASTAILIARSGRPAFPTRFVVNRPFLFLIRDTATNVILFIGIVRRPYE